MFILGNILETVAGILSTLITIYTYVIIISAVISWVNPDPYNPVIRTLRSLTEPVYYKIRKHLPFVMTGGFDFSPIIVLVIINLIDGILIRSLMEIAYKL